MQSRYTDPIQLLDALQTIAAYAPVTDKENEYGTFGAEVLYAAKLHLTKRPTRKFVGNTTAYFHPANVRYTEK